MQFEYYVLNYDINKRKVEPFNVFNNCWVQEQTEKEIKKYIRNPKNYKYKSFWKDEKELYGFNALVKRIFSETIEFNDEYCYPITIGAMQILIKKLSDELQKVNFNKMDEVDEYSVNKLLCAIEDLSKIINNAIWDYQDGIEYEYRVFDSF